MSVVCVMLPTSPKFALKIPLDFPYWLMERVTSVLLISASDVLLTLGLLAKEGGSWK